MKILKNKFTTDLIVNYVSLLLFGITGLTINFFIALLYGSQAIGYFNITYSIYIVFSQIVSLGIWNSALKFVSENNGNIDNQREEICSLILMSFLSTILLSIPTYFITDYFIPKIFNSSINLSWKYIFPGFICYSINKTLLAIVNGKRKMIAYASFLSAKYIIMLILVMIFYWFKTNVVYLPLIFSLSDLPITIILLFYILISIKPHMTLKIKTTIKVLKYGIKNLPSNIISELNTRIDVLILGALSSEQSVGIYSFAASFTEGLSLILTPLRDNINPMISMYLAKNMVNRLKNFLNKCVRFSYLSTSILGTILFCVYLLLSTWAFSGQEVILSILIFSILIASVILASGYLPLNMFLSQAGMPKEQMYVRLLCMGTNISGCFLFIPSLGATGAAIAIFLSNLTFILMLKYFIDRRLEYVNP